MIRDYILLFCVFITPLAYPFEFPDEWRLPTEKELSKEPLREKSPTKNAKIEADFNGDGNIDHAFLLKRTTYNGEGLVIWLSTTSEYSWQVIDEISRGEENQNIGPLWGIDLAKPGKYKTACGKGYWVCENGEPEVLELKLPGIWHYKFENTASMWFWDTSTNKFQRIWISD